MKLNWYLDFFHGIALDLWRQAIPPERTRLEADFLADALALSPGARVLDVPCGSGRHASDLAARGFRVTGVDLSPEQIAAARGRSTPQGTPVDWRLADMRELPWREEFDGALCFGNSFGYLDPDGTREFIRAVSQALKPGGRFVLDSGMVAESILTHLREREWSQIGDILFLEENRYHVETSCLETVYTFVRDGEIQTRIGLQWVYTMRELRNLLGEFDLSLEHLFGDLDRRPFQVGSPYLILVARKA